MTIKTKKQYIDALKKYASIVNKKQQKPCDRCDARKLSVQIWVWENRNK